MRTHYRFLILLAAAITVLPAVYLIPPHPARALALFYFGLVVGILVARDD